MDYNKIANILDRAASDVKAIEQISKTKKINVEEAYAIQSISLMKRYQRGEQLVGLKMGFTSKAKMEQMGVHDLIWGRLTDTMYRKNGDVLKREQFINPRAEPEIAFLLSQDITDEITLETAKNYIDGIAIAIEIVDSRYENFKFTIEDVIADNSSAAAFSIGDWQHADTRIDNLKMELLINDEVVREGNSNAILGNPLESLISAVRLVLENGEILTKGAIILAGAVTPAVFIKAGQRIVAKSEGLGQVSLNCE